MSYVLESYSKCPVPYLKYGPLFTVNTFSKYFIPKTYYSVWVDNSSEISHINSISIALEGFHPEVPAYLDSLIIYILQ